VVQQLCEEAVSGRGNLIVTAAPPELKSDLPVWGTPRDDFVLMQRVKEQMDPNRLLNPGRFVGGL
jgi:glycolate oxidase FAD binding subunit